MTGDYVTDYIEAEGSMLFNVKKREWSDKLCGILGLNCEMLPGLVSPTDIVGGISDEGAKISGLAVGTPGIAGTTDTAMEVFCFMPVESCRGEPVVMHCFQAQ